MTAKFKIMVLLSIITIGLIAYLALGMMIKSALTKGETHEGMYKWMANLRIDTLKVALERFKVQHGHYPITKSKYYLDSLVEYVYIDDVYIYRDSISNGEIIKPKNLAEFPPVSTSRTNLYIGIGDEYNKIIYHSDDGISYELKYSPDPPVIK